MQSGPHKVLQVGLFGTTIDTKDVVNITEQFSTTMKQRSYQQITEDKIKLFEGDHVIPDTIIYQSHFFISFQGHHFFSLIDRHIFIAVL